MLVSRKDIQYESIEQGNFLKLPVEQYLGLLGIEAIPSQIAIINAVNSKKYRFVCAAISRRQGKTYIANILGQLVSLVPGCHILVMSPNYNLSQISFDLQRQLLKHFDLEVAKDNAKDRVIELTNGSTIRMGSVNQVDSTVGRSYDFIIFDEAALADGETAFNVALRPTLDKAESKALFISTPRGRNNWFSRFYQRGFNDEYPEWCSVHATWQDNPRATAEDIEEAKKTMSEAEFNQEYMADFNVFEGQIWKFDYENCVADLSEMEFRNCDVISGLDVGFKDPTAFLVIMFDGEKFYVVEEYYEAEKTTEQHAEVIGEIMERRLVDYCFIDSAAQQTRFDLAQNYDITTTNAKKSVNDGIAHVSSLVENNRLIIDQRCLETLRSMDQYRWDPNPNLIREKPLHDSSSHMADALRYALYSFETNATSF
jgi:phage terminase large subunit|tara:strand:+ start:981 stop:2261 length:1281 start_codon:yes stop_codon:yes gene_type:complete